MGLFWYAICVIMCIEKGGTMKKIIVKNFCDFYQLGKVLSKEGTPSLWVLERKQTRF